MATYKDIYRWWESATADSYKHNAVITFITTRLPDEVDQPIQAVGIDPGRNFAIARIDRRHLEVLYGEFNKADAIQYAEWAATLMRTEYAWAVDIPVTVEGAAYGGPGRKKQGYKYGQVGLAYIRFGFYLPMSRITRAAIVPPATIRKIAFGNGNIKARDLWPDMNENAAAAIGCAFHAARLTIDTTGYDGS